MGNFFIIAFLFAILMTPIASVTVTTMGRPSGMAATARLNNKKKKIYVLMLMTLHGTNEPMHTCEHTHTHALTE